MGKSVSFQEWGIEEAGYRKIFCVSKAQKLFRN
jgi:hypothetical protein